MFVISTSIILLSVIGIDLYCNYHQSKLNPSNALYRIFSPNGTLKWSKELVTTLKSSFSSLCTISQLPEDTPLLKRLKRRHLIEFGNTNTIIRYGNQMVLHTILESNLVVIFQFDIGLDNEGDNILTLERLLRERDNLYRSPIFKAYWSEIKPPYPITALYLFKTQKTVLNDYTGFIGHPFIISTNGLDELIQINK